ncbi:MAG: histidine phosphatase family protein [Nanoarchaeota archaeon]|nr:histidine phosphatase family protein [Nanoarchaeota archaeon]MBU1322219.1 histidine phosphatase family protein [Nanoarchaeota archaeon]MBU1597760.1 histidine phosphatase family protein [Nanoarchaeota archaeon]MBU2442024.1 histidine phosphatase family protein [Nanoarchaeota archaeon]
MKWPKRLVIVRHGESVQNAILDLEEANLEKKVIDMKKIRDMDIDLTNVGEWQATQTGIYLAKTEPFDICFYSPYRRTRRTAELIVAEFHYDLKFFADERLREKEFGKLHGHTTEEIKEKYRDEFEARERDGKYWYRLLGGENYPDVRQRMHSFSDKLVRDYSGKNILIVTHHVPYLLFRAQFEHLGEEEVLGLEGMPNCAIQEYEIDFSVSEEGRMKKIKYNKTAYDMSKAPERKIKV